MPYRLPCGETSERSQDGKNFQRQLHPERGGISGLRAELTTSGRHNLKVGKGGHSVGDPALHAFQNFLDEAQVVPLGVLPLPEGRSRVAKMVKY